MKLIFLIIISFFYFKNDDYCDDLSAKISSIDEKTVIKSFAQFYQKCPEKALTIPCFFPLKNFENTAISSKYGIRKHPISGITKHHNGIDIASPIKEVIATASGIVVETGFDRGLGNFVIIDHQNSYQTTYGHLSKILVSKGQTVIITETIGILGSTGASTGNHIHYEIRKNEVLVNPIDYLLLFYQSQK